MLPFIAMDRGYGSVIDLQDLVEAALELIFQNLEISAVDIPYLKNNMRVAIPIANRL